MEYALLSELLQDGWLRRNQPVDVLRADVDSAGYDLMLECQGGIRHVQLKSSVVGGKTREQKVHSAPARQRAGCVIWVVLEPGGQHRLRLTYLVFGGTPGKSLGDLSAYPVARHTKGNVQGVKAERHAIQVVPVSAFTPLATTAELSDWLFRAPAPGGLV